MTEAKKPSTKKVTIYRNGDPSFRPVQYTYQSQKVKTFPKLLEDIDRVAPPLRGGGVRSLYTIDGQTKIQTLEEFEGADGVGFVAGGNEPYKEVKGGYENIGKSKKEQQAAAAKKDTAAAKKTAEKEKEEEKKEKEEEKKEKEAEKKEKEAEKVAQKEREKEREKEKAAAKKEESYVEKNKKKYGDQPRSEDQRVENRVDVGDIKRITVYRNGDAYYKPKQYIYKGKTMKNWDKFLEDLGKIAPPMKGGGVRKIFTMDGGTEIKKFDELQEGEGYVVTGIEGYQPLKQGYENVGKPEGSPRKQANKEGKEANEPNDAEQDKGKQKAQRNSDEKLMNRKDQTAPEPAFYFVFKNGNGLEAKRFIFTPKQLEKGMPWLLEQVGKKFDIYAKKLVTMDNRDIHTVSDLMNKGSYVVIPLGEQFRDTWYYLPQLAKDTSADAQDSGNANGEKRQGTFEKDGNQRRPGDGRGPNRQQGGNRPQDGGRNQQRHPDSREYDDYDRNHPQDHGRRPPPRRYSDDYYDEEYDSRTESGQEYYSDEEYVTPRRRADGREPAKHNHRPDTSGSYCSYCDMLERHRHKHHFYSDEEESYNNVPPSRRSQRPYTTDEGRRPPPTSDRRRQPTSHGRRPSRVYEDEPYDDERYDDEYDRLPPPKQRTNTSLRRARSEANMEPRSRQEQPLSRSQTSTKMKSSSAEQQKNQNNRTKSQPQQGRSNSQSTLNKSRR